MTTDTLTPEEEAVQELLDEALSDVAYAYAPDDKDDGPRFHPNVIRFYSDDPYCNFDGFKGSVHFEANLLVDESDDDHKHRLERVGGVLLYTGYDRKNRSTYHAGGQALICEQGSPAESQFIANAVQFLLKDASEPLRSAVESIQEGGFKFTPELKLAMLSLIFRA